MKLRTGFVSNSSSSSFTIFYRPNILSIPCPTCNRSDIDFFDLLNKENEIDDDTRLRSTDGQDYVKELEEEIKTRKYDIVEQKLRPPYSEYSSYWRIPVKEFIEKEEELIKELEKTLQLIKDKLQDGFSFAKFSVSYHNNSMLARIRNMEERGVIEIFNSENE